MPSTEPTESADVNLSKMTKEQLLNYAEEHGIDGVDSTMLKADILAAVTAAGT